jgi:predicted dehydrogenase
LSASAIHIGLYGTNGHQLPLDLPPRARVVAVAQYPTAGLDPSIRVYDSLAAMLNDPEIDLVSLCSARRIEQAQHAIQCLRAGKHVLAEKPCAFSAAELDAILETAAKTGRSFREMAASELAPPLQAIRRLVDDGVLGTIVHVQAHKSYPWHNRRPQDAAVDGGLIRQVGIHAVRFIHGATGLRITSIAGLSTSLGNPGTDRTDPSRRSAMAAAFSVELENGGLGSINLNYLNPTSFCTWGNDQLRVFGTQGMVETVDGFRRHRLYVPGYGGTDPARPTDLPFPEDLVSPLYIEHYVRYLLDGTPTPTPFEEEMAMTRAMLALQDAVTAGVRIRVAYPDRGDTDASS